jgi:hypothetical protein
MKAAIPLGLERILMLGAAGLVLESSAMERT